MSNIAETNELEGKIEVNRDLLIKLHKEFGDNILFTGGTSLMERNIINRFSEDIDLIISVSRKKIEQYIKNDSSYIITNKESNSKMNSYEIDVNHSGTQLTTKIDLVSLNNRYPNFSLEDLHKDNYITLEGYDENIYCKSVQLILHDKICAIIEDYEVIKEYIESHKKRGFKSRQIDRKYFIREMRHYYDVASIMEAGYVVDKNELTNEVKRRINTNDTTNKKLQNGLDNIEYIDTFINNPNYFNKIFELFNDQLFQDKKHVEHRQIQGHINLSLGIMIKIVRDLNIK